MSRPKKYNYDWPGVTTIIGLLTNLQYWYGKYGTAECEKRKRISQDIGHRVHNGIEKYLKTRKLKEAQKELKDDHELQMLKKFVKYIKNKNIKQCSTEVTVHSNEHQYGGTMDYLGDYILDWKTDSVPKGKSDERERIFKYKLQLAGYAIAVKETLGKIVDVGKIFRVSKDLKEKEYTFDITNKLKNQFLALRDIYRELKGK